MIKKTGKGQMKR